MEGRRGGSRSGPRANEILKVGKMIGIVRSGGSIGESECVPFGTALCLGRVQHGADQRGVGVVEFPYNLVVAPLSAQSEEMRVVVVGLYGLDLAVGHSSSNAARGHPLPAGEVRKQVAHSHAVGVRDIIEPMSQLVSDGGQVSTSLIHARQKSIPIGHARQSDRRSSAPQWPDDQPHHLRADTQCWRDAMAPKPSDWTLRGVVNGPREVDPAVRLADEWCAWARGPNKERIEGRGPSPQDALLALTVELRALGG